MKKFLLNLFYFFEEKRKKPSSHSHIKHVCHFRKCFTSVLQTFIKQAWMIVSEWEKFEGTTHIYEYTSKIKLKINIQKAISIYKIWKHLSAQFNKLNTLNLVQHSRVSERDSLVRCVLVHGKIIFFIHHHQHHSLSSFMSRRKEKIQSEWKRVPKI